MRRSTVLSLSIKQGFPGFAHAGDIFNFQPKAVARIINVLC
jgi:hypothetical protein